MSSLELCRRTRQVPAPRNPQIIFLAGAEVSLEERAQVLAVGADGYMTYPITDQLLLARVQAVLRAKQAQEQIESPRPLSGRKPQSCPSGLPRRRLALRKCRRPAAAGHVGRHSGRNAARRRNLRLHRRHHRNTRGELDISCQDRTFALFVVSVSGEDYLNIYGK